METAYYEFIECILNGWPAVGGLAEIISQIVDCVCLVIGKPTPERQMKTVRPRG